MDIVFGISETLTGRVSRYLDRQSVASIRCIAKQYKKDIWIEKGNWWNYVSNEINAKRCGLCKAICTTRQVEYCPLCEQWVCIGHLEVCRECNSIFCSTCRGFCCN